MEEKFVGKIFIYFLCISFLLLTSGFHTMVAEAKEIGRPIGEMISRGEVKFESRENVWKDVEPSHFPIFQGVKIKIGKGDSAVTLADDSQIEVGSNSFLSFDRNDQIHLIQGTINFRFPSTAEVSVNVGNLTVMKYRSLHASKNPSAVQENGDTIGSISAHPNGLLTVKSLQGSLSVVNQDHVVLAALSPKDTVTIPSVTANSPSKVMVARAGETTSGPEASSPETEKKKRKSLDGGEFLGLTTETWFWIGFGLTLDAVIGVGIAIYENNKGGHHHYRPVCP